MKKCVFLSMDDLSGYEVYDELLISPMNDAGWTVDTISWRNTNVNWNEFTVVIIRSTWDYQKDAKFFLKVLNAIDDSSAHLDNPIGIIEWNINKHYLRELESKGVLIVKTEWYDSITMLQLEQSFERLNTPEIIVKPCISAGSIDTFRLNKINLAQLSGQVIESCHNRQMMLQPFESAIITEGEFSIFYFDDCYSHTIRKTPKENDFRVQEEFGGNLLKVEPEIELIQQAEKVLKAIGHSLLYARLDFVRTKKGFALMEAELIEPSLYFKFDANAPQNFVDALQRRMRRLGVIS